jgi:hypothetical protein
MESEDRLAGDLPGNRESDAGPRVRPRRSRLRGLRDGPDLSGTREWIDFKTNADLVRKTRGLGDKPLSVLTRSPHWGGDDFVPDEWEALVEPIHQELQAGLCTLSTRCKHIVAAKAGHSIQRDEPQLVIDAILDVVRQTRTARTP